MKDRTAPKSISSTVADGMICRSVSPNPNTVNPPERTSIDP